MLLQPRGFRDIPSRRSRRTDGNTKTGRNAGPTDVKVRPTEACYRFCPIPN